MLLTDFLDGGASDWTEVTSREWQMLSTMKMFLKIAVSQHDAVNSAVI